MANDVEQDARNHAAQLFSADRDSPIVRAFIVGARWQADRSAAEAPIRRVLEKVGKAVGVAEVKAAAFERQGYLTSQAEQLAKADGLEIARVALLAELTPEGRSCG